MIPEKAKIVLDYHAALNTINKKYKEIMDVELEKYKTLLRKTEKQ